MKTILRSIESSVRSFVRSIRQAQRHSPRLPVKMTMVDPRATKGSMPRFTLNGFTRNISASGLAIVVPEIKLGDRHLVGDNRKLLLVIELPTGTVKLEAQPVRFEKIRHGQLEGHYLIGAKIVQLDPADRVRFSRFLHRLDRQQQIGQKLARTA